ncbi:hypothetical protein D3870_07275 [Noviherbaspirillum cavernae]|uniref:Uncharacterized protein n=1 Tax=Noviherbaspirillum cavernae TaxID=2320862 RepID=A0A418X008_9BURK|nr:hypothetical protein [Noviherbaspirillum cavernae]RJG05844.1 hypothetical protein D3870_07275 [Noviherbaspirillum cavernae]
MKLDWWAELDEPNYRPIEAAIRWGGLIAEEAEILAVVDSHGIPWPDATEFPQWACVQALAERLWDAIIYDRLPAWWIARSGRKMQAVESLPRAAPGLKIFHRDLKEWMIRRYPSQRPAFLFDEIERTEHAHVDAPKLQAVQAERDALQAQLNETDTMLQVTRQSLADVMAERDALHAQIVAMAAERDAALEKPFSTTERNSVLTVLAAVLDYSDIDPTARGSAKQVEGWTEQMGARVTDDTIRRIFSQIPAAVDSRRTK